MKGEQKELKPLHHRVIDAMLNGASQTDAARDAGVTTRAIRYMQQNPAFVAELERRRAARAEAMDRSAAFARMDPARVLDVRCMEAVEMLVARMRDGRPAESMKAARTVLDIAGVSASV